MAKDTVTNQQLYGAIMDVHKKIDEVVEKRITPLEVWRAEIMGKIAVIIGVINLGVAISFDWIKKNIFQDKI